MPDLIAQSADTAHFWRIPLVTHHGLVIGRHSLEAGVPWDNKVSRQHARLCWDGRKLVIERIPGAKNPVFVRGAAGERFEIEVGDRFVIGDTTFLLVASPDEHTESRPTPYAVQPLRRDAIQMQRFQEAAQRIDALSRLPRIIRPGDAELELAGRVVELVMDGVTRASAVAVVEYDSRHEGRFRILHGEQRGRASEEYEPSWRLLRQVHKTGEGVLHLWGAPGDDGLTETLPTERAGIDWAFCLPIGGEGPQWFLYVEGDMPVDQTAEPSLGLEDDVKFAEIVTSALANLRTAQTWERRHARIRPFFSPQVLQWLDGSGEEALEPRQAHVSVMFCDLRGFSQQAELSADDLMALLDRVSRSLGIMTAEILQAGGVIGDFHGDAAMGFWGWPVADEEDAVRACRAAGNIRAQLSALHQDSGSLPLFEAGIGLASGSAVAGAIGSADQVKVTVFGPVVNRAARLEQLTKPLRAPVLMDAETVELVRQLGQESGLRVRRLGRVELPKTGRIETVFELLPPARDDESLSDAALGEFEAAVTSFEAGDWEQAFERFHRVPHADRVKDRYIWHIVAHNRRAPSNWDGVLRLDADLSR